jgi:phosphatidylcholine synthase
MRPTPESPGQRTPPPLRARILAWGVHGYTALGLVAAAAMAVLIVRGGDDGFRAAFLLMAAATLLDATDGTAARWARVETVLPGFDGRRLDDIVDFHTYTSLPLLLVWRAELLPPSWAPWLLVPLLASAYGFAQTEAKTTDGYFLGFPSYWNAIAFYLYFLQPPPAVALALLLAFAGLTFLPARYLYPTRPGPLRPWTLALGAAWTAMLAAVLLLPEPPAALVVGSLFYPAYYLAASWIVTLRLRG